MRKSRDTGRKHQEILDAALQVFGQSGYDATSMDRIAGTAGASKRTVYNHFPSKRDLYVTLMGQLVEKVSGAKHVTFSRDEDPQDQLEQIIRAELQILDNPTGLRFAFTVYSFVHREPSLAPELEERYSGREKALHAWLIAATEVGILHVVDPRKATELLWAIVDGVFVVAESWTRPRLHTAYAN